MFLTPCVSFDRYCELSVKAKSALQLLVVLPVLAVANQADKLGVEPPSPVVPAQTIPVTDTPPVDPGPQEGGPAKADEAQSQATEVAGAREVLAANFSEQDRLLADRVEARWKAMVEKNFESAYGYTLPSYRQANTLEQFAKVPSRSVVWRKAQVRSIRYDDPQIARVKIALESELVTPWSVGQPEKRVTGLEETWLNRDGIWWLSPK